MGTFRFTTRSLVLATAGVLSLGLPLTAHAGTASSAPAPVFAGIFGDHAVLQRDQPLTLWGTAAPGARLTITLGQQAQTVTSGKDGRWQVRLSALPAGGPYDLAVSDKAGGKTLLHDIMIGDVWLCAGQSNMELKVREAQQAWKPLAAPANPTLRFTILAKDAEPAAVSDLKTPAMWQISSPATVGEVSAACYYMSQSLQRDQGVTIGMVQASWGGSWIQTWIGAKALTAVPGYGDGERILADYARDSAAGLKEWQGVLDAWWAHAEPQAVKEAWSSAAFDDSSWPAVTPDARWAAQKKPDFTDINGLYWYRGHVTLTQAQADTANTIQLGHTHGSDTVWINDREIGRSNTYDMPRTYGVQGVFKAGDNVIVTRIVDNGSGGGLYADPRDQFLTLADGTQLPLAPAWKYHLSMSFNALGHVPDAPWSDRVGLSELYNGMIAPLGNYRFKGAAWYQGEQNTSNPAEYGPLLSLMMQDWRTGLAQPDLPFLIVQLPGYGAPSRQPGQSPWAEMREAQRLAVAADPHAAYAVTVDIGDRFDIHPGEKFVLGQRLARAAQALAYGEAITPSGPKPQSVVRTGDDLVVTFGDTDGGLATYSADTALGFETCDAAQTCRYVTAVADHNTVILKGANRPDVVSLRYAWSDAPVVNLFSAADLPVTPFQLKVP